MITVKTLTSAPTQYAPLIRDLSAGQIVTIKVAGRVAIASAYPISVFNGVPQSPAEITPMIIPPPPQPPGDYPTGVPVIAGWFDPLARPRAIEGVTGVISIYGQGYAVIWAAVEVSGDDYFPEGQLVQVINPITVQPNDPGSPFFVEGTVSIANQPITVQSSTTSSVPLETVVGVDYNRRFLGTFFPGGSTSTGARALSRWYGSPSGFTYTLTPGVWTDATATWSGSQNVTQRNVTCRGPNLAMLRNPYLVADAPLPNGIVVARGTVWGIGQSNTLPAPTLSVPAKAFVLVDVSLGATVSEVVFDGVTYPFVSNPFTYLFYNARTTPVDMKVQLNTGTSAEARVHIVTSFELYNGLAVVGAYPVTETTYGMAITTATSVIGQAGNPLETLYASFVPTGFDYAPTAL